MSRDLIETTGTREISPNTPRFLSDTIRETVKDHIRTSRDRTLGRVLTIIDATTQDITQRKALKDLMVTAIWSENDSQIDEIATLVFNKLGKGRNEKPFYYTDDRSVYLNDTFKDVVPG